MPFHQPPKCPPGQVERIGASAHHGIVALPDTGSGKTSNAGRAFFPPFAHGPRFSFADNFVVKTFAAMHPVTRADAMARLCAFVPQAGLDYAAGRNRDHGPGRHAAVSRLSAALRRRTISEAEVLAPVLARHGRAADAYVAEVFWRSYFRGWLEQRPQVWHDWLTGLDRIDASLAANDTLAARHLAATRGETGIDCFDHWIAELDQTGYLHNWARMQVASIWVHTLRLPWQTGARMMAERLIDWCPASNTLSWRWVAGLHTRGKAYLADRTRIHLMTDGRFDPHGLSHEARIPEEPPAPPPSPVRTISTPAAGVPTLLWITPEDCSLETELALAHLAVRAVAIVATDHPADATALDDAMARASAHWSVPGMRVNDARGLAALAKECGAAQVVAPYAATGPAFDRMVEGRAALRREGLALAEHWREWDRAAWPHATRGFFAMKQHIPALIAASGILTEG